MSMKLNLTECYLLCWGVKTWIVHVVKTMQYREKLKQSKNMEGKVA